MLLGIVWLSKEVRLVIDNDAVVRSRVSLPLTVINLISLRYIGFISRGIIYI